MSYISPNKVFSHLDRLAAWQHGDKPAPITVEIDLTNVCSLGCQGCHFRHTHVAGPWASQSVVKPVDYSDTGKIAHTQRLCTAFAEMAAAGVQGVVFSGGGEPTLHPDFDRIVTAAHDAGLQVGLYTLGGHISEARADVLKRCATFVVVSLDAWTPATYAKEKHVPESRFHDACDGIARLSGGKTVVGVSFLLHAENWSDTHAMLAQTRRLGANYTTFRPTINVSMDNPSQMTDDRSWVTAAEPYLRQLATYPDVEIDVDRFLEYRDWTDHGYTTCYGIRLVTQITPDGRMWVCPNRRGMVGSELGNLNNESFAAIWSRHPGQWNDFRECRAMCRLHIVNETLAVVHETRRHTAFI